MEDRLVEILGRITTRDEAGRHFLEIYADEDLKELESEGLIEIYRPIHESGILYDCQYWQIEVTDAGRELVKCAYC